MQHAEAVEAQDSVVSFVSDAHQALTDLGLRNKMISLPAPAKKGRSIDFAVDPDVLVDLFSKPDAALRIGTDPLIIAPGSQRTAADLRRAIVTLIADAETIASEQGIETRRLAIGAIAWKDAENAIRTAPLFTMPVTVTSDLVIAPAGSLEPNETFPLFAASLGCTVGIDPTKPPSKALSVKAHSVEPVKAGGMAILGYTPRVNLNLYAGKSAAMHRALDLSARPHLNEVGALKVLAGCPPIAPTVSPATANLHVVQADLSQDEAITAARAGESFVLQGPPGTGKSQTIVNIVANLLNDGKRVLVSAEKTAALEIIVDRWPKDRAGLPSPVILTENGAALPPDTAFAVSTPAVAALKIPPGTAFDVVIVDEASQVRLSHGAVVAALASQIIVIGDSQQMAPSASFARASQSQTSTAMIVSLLDHAVASRLPSRMLKQHYRSKHESLILFSSKAYYQSQLDIIPSPLLDGSLGATFRFVPHAVYDRGGKGDNLIEAQALIADAVAYAKENHARRHHPHGGALRSIGIITLNEPQRDLILTLLPDALAKEGLSETDLAGGTGLERLFVKSLENVQGDERDIILVSMTYGPDRKGRFIANLGLLSQAGAANRVNVLATRSKWKTIVYHSFDMTGLNRSDHDGSAAFKKYWRALNTASTVTPVATPSGEPNPDDELDIAFRLMQKRLTSERFNVHKFPRFIAGYERNKPHRYILCFYFEGLYSPLQEASDIARIKSAGWTLCRIPLERWRAETKEAIDGVYRALMNATINKIEL
ncbi:AAA family ATPase [Microvirga sp. BT688]|uniref:AAA domain-containing protein n=1 Tax=Microvirga sp. TaxID=1873136 RepID=UPI0016847F57|nr:AAA domain-containing protein [Microvirga sp.]MBD2745992.1 AAA family ATPase [Microvirga sp.]